MEKTKIDWAESSWNPVTGCYHGCDYCYARSMVKRFSPVWAEPESNKARKNLIVLDEPYIAANGRRQPYPWGFLPTFHRYRLDDYKNKKGRTIFVCSMADLFGDWIPDEWIQEVFNACAEAPQHRYLFLTKNPDRYNDLARRGMLPQEHWYGYTATDQNMLWTFRHADECLVKNLFVSIEPILKPMHPGFCSHTPADWVIIGAETGQRAKKVIPKREWIESIAQECLYSGRPIFMKGSLQELMGEDFIQEFPWKEEQ